MRQLQNAARLWRTVKYLRAVQIYRRFWFRLVRPHPDLSPAPNLRKQLNRWKVPARRLRSLVNPETFRLLNEVGRLDELGWDNPKKTKLWRYNQHYFDDLNAEAAAERIEWHKALISTWISANSPGRGTGWESYPTSIRIVNWIKWALYGNMLTDVARESLATQTRWLAKRLEWHLLGNHLFANAKALVFAGLFFDGEEADGWLERGWRILKRQIPEQILSDGGQFELSPMYHALAVEDLLDLQNLAQTFDRNDFAQSCSGLIMPMLTWLRAMSHPDGGIAFFNDAAFGVAPDNTELEAYARRLGFEASEPLGPVSHLEDSGYVRLAAGPFVLIADFAKIGPAYLPGHAHADSLSVELSLAGQRVFVNSGTSEYGAGPERQRQRGTAAHNTVAVSGQDSSEVWAGFRVGRRAQPFGETVFHHGGVLRAQCSHDGYRYLPGRPTVTRSIELTERQLTIVDRVSGGSPSEARYHLHPSITIVLRGDYGALLELPGGERFEIEIQGQPLRVDATTWHAQFGIIIPNSCMVVPLLDGQATLAVKKI